MSYQKLPNFYVIKSKEALHSIHFILEEDFHSIQNSVLWKKTENESKEQLF